MGMVRGADPTRNDMRVLIADDDPIALEILRDMLETAGHEVFAVENGKAALDELAREECSLVITDWEMPELNGLDVCRAIRQMGSSGYVYTILLTGHDSVSE